jgi:branched-chain amino acid transport system substrate-binding protein
MSKRAACLLAAMLLLAVACGNVEDDGAGGRDEPAPTATASSGDLTTNLPIDQPGVTDTEIRVGGVASVTNPLGGNYGEAFQGVEAYFAMINEEQGGIYGRSLELVAERDDQLANNLAEVQGLISQDNVFAVLPVATLLFTGADTLASEGVPTFGWTINPEWTGPPNLFGDRGSMLCFDCPGPILPWLAQEEQATNVAILAYNVPQSANCARGIKNSFEKYPTAEVVFEDSALGYGVTDFNVQVGKMKDAGVDFVTTCMDNNGVTSLAREMARQQLDAVQYMPNGYNAELISEFADLFEGSYVLTWAVPFEFEDQPPGMVSFLDWIDRTGGTPSELSMSGWLAADLFYQGLVAAGPEFTRQKVVDAINTFEDWNADGAIPGVDWRIRHTEMSDEGCYAISKVVDGGFVPQFTEPGRPFICFDLTADTLPEQPEIKAGGPS